MYLNVFVPKNTTESKAVMLFIHGGNFQFQGANSLLFDGRYMTNLSDCIIVTIQYRLGNFLKISLAYFNRYLPKITYTILVRYNVIKESFPIDPQQSQRTSERSLTMHIDAH